MFELDDVLVLDYLMDSREGLAAAEKDLLAFESGGGNSDEGRITRICLALHSLKGGSLSFDLMKIGELAQKTENAIARLRFQRSAPTHARISVLLSAIDRLNEMILRPDTSNGEDITDLLTQLALPDADLSASVEKTVQPAISKHLEEKIACESFWWKTTSLAGFYYRHFSLATAIVMSLSTAGKLLKHFVSLWMAAAATI